MSWRQWSSMISACAGCQSRTYIDWLTWSQDCTSPSLTTFPEPLPSAVVVPSWAYLNLSLTNNDFNVPAAEKSKCNISGWLRWKLNPWSSVASETSATSSAITSSTSVSNSITPSTTALASSASAGSSKSNAGAISGGVVGGIAFVAIVGLGTIWFCLRRKRNMVQRNVAFDSPSTQGISPFLPQPSQTIHTSDMSSYHGTPFTTTGGFTTVPPSRRSLESVSHCCSIWRQ